MPDEKVRKKQVNYVLLAVYIKVSPRSVTDEEAMNNRSQLCFAG